ncbi:hypothetical protein M8C21_018721 [Ambrosia artemisiifolia]|uniref:non-specific serine/threonine protein kinase n=1 Tax=Ambrosia artemisiifolia TaxID=4212 RepID=A0AAD5DI45_AMBAR|nr:hypothetical protein M8C21_018721 [Ambrosia artemisiifolia]
MGATGWRFNGDTCNLDLIAEVPKLTPEANATTGCECNITNNTDCHVVRITLKFYSLPGVLSPELTKLPYLKSISLLGNRITGKIPPELGNITTLTKLDLEANYLSGTVPSQLGRLSNLKSLILSSNQLTGTLPAALGELRNLTNFRINDSNFSGRIPDFIQNWRQLNRLEMVASGLEGPIPSSISLLEDLADLRIGDMAGPMQRFPPLNNASGLIRLVLRNCNLSGELPAYVWMIRELEMLFLTSNMLSGDIPDSLLLNGANRTYLPAPSISSVQDTGVPCTLIAVEMTRELKKAITTLFMKEMQMLTVGRLVKKNFNIEDESGGMGNPVVIPFNASVTNNILEIRFYWAGKGTTRFPRRGVYGPLVSAVSVEPYFKTCLAGGKKKKNKIAYVGIAVGASCFVLLVLAVIWWKRSLKRNKRKDKDFQGLELRTISFSLKQLKSATHNFDAANKIGEGGFGPVYKGTLGDGTVVAVKQLSSESRQGNREFLNEVGVISCLQHPNLVKLHGCCIEGDQLMLVYEYLENNSLSNALFGLNKSGLMLDWPTRFKICIGIARGLAFLHEESRLKIVHRDIKATNVLLDKDLNPKIADFGLARLHEDDQTHVSTRVAGTIGYMAPEYALWGYLSDKADVYSFGVLALEIVSGKSNTSYIPRDNFICLLDWACQLQKSQNYEELFDEKLGSNINKEEAEIVVKIALLCTNGSPSIRPIMSEVVSMLEGQTCVPEIDPEAGGYTDDLRFKAMRDFREEKYKKTSRSQNSTSVQTDPLFSLSSYDHSEIEPVETR